MAWAQGHIIQFAYIPCIDYDPSAIRLIPDEIDHLGQLIDHPTVRRTPGSPLRSVNGPQIPIFIRPLVPDSHPMILEVPDVGISLDKPKQFVDDRFEMKFFGGHQWKSLPEIKSGLITEYTPGTGTRPVSFVGPIFQNMIE